MKPLVCMDEGDVLKYRVDERRYRGLTVLMWTWKKEKMEEKADTRRTIIKH